MGYRIENTYHPTEEEARAQQSAATGRDAGYSETYALGVFPCRLRNRDTGEEYDGFKSVTETYYG